MKGEGHRTATPRAHEMNSTQVSHFTCLDDALIRMVHNLPSHEKAHDATND